MNCKNVKKLEFTEMGHQFKIREREEIEDDSRLPDWVTKKKKKKALPIKKMIYIINGYLLRT